MTNIDTSIDRSKIVRSRRMQLRAGKVARRRDKNIPARNVPNMVSRKSNRKPRISAGQAEARRRYPLQLATEGAELHLPALPTISFGWRAVSASLVGFLLAALYFLLSAPIFSVARVELAGAERVNAQEINAALNISGASIFTVQPEELSSIIAEEFPELQDFAVKVAYPARVVVHVLERQPLIAWQQSGITVWLDSAGIAIIPQGELPNLITVQAAEAPPSIQSDKAPRNQLLDPQIISAILTLNEFVPTETPLLFDPKLGFGWQDPAGWSAYFGTQATDIDQRLAVYLTIVNELSSRGLSPTMISVAQLHAPYYRMDY